jgi:hypothetical protein
MQPNSGPALTLFGGCTCTQGELLSGRSMHGRLLIIKEQLQLLTAGAGSWLTLQIKYTSDLAHISLAPKVCPIQPIGLKQASLDDYPHGICHRDAQPIRHAGGSQRKLSIRGRRLRPQ